MSVNSVPMSQQDKNQIKPPSPKAVILMVCVFVGLIVSICVILTRIHYDLRFQQTTQQLQNFVAVQQQFNKDVFRQVDELIFIIQQDLIIDGLPASEIKQHYTMFDSLNPLLDSLMILDASGTVIYASDTSDFFIGENLATSDYFAVHQQAIQSQNYIADLLQLQSNNRFVLPISSGVYQDDTLQNVITVFISIPAWGEMQIASNTNTRILDEQLMILTSFPYDEQSVGRQVDEAYIQLDEPYYRLSSLSHEGESLFVARPIDNYPLYLLVEYTNLAKFYTPDSVTITTLAIALLSIVSGAGVLLIFSRQYRTINGYTNQLMTINAELGNEVESRRQAEMTATQSEERYRQLTDLISDYAFSILMDEDGKPQLE